MSLLQHQMQTGYRNKISLIYFLFIATSGHNPQFHSISLLHHLTCLIFTFSSLTDYPGVIFLWLLCYLNTYRMSLLPTPTVPSKNFNLRICILNNSIHAFELIILKVLPAPPGNSVENVQLFNSNKMLLFIKIFLQLEDMGTKDFIRRANAFSPHLHPCNSKSLLKQNKTYPDCVSATWSGTQKKHKNKEPSPPTTAKNRSNKWRRLFIDKNTQRCSSYLF